MSILKKTNYPLPAHILGIVIAVSLNSLLDYYSVNGLEPIKYIFLSHNGIYDEVMYVGKIEIGDPQPEKH